MSRPLFAGWQGQTLFSGRDYFLPLNTAGLKANFWDTQTSGNATTGGTIGEYATGKTTLEMKFQSTFTGWRKGTTIPCYR